MPKIETEITPDLARQMQRIIRDGWFPDETAIIREAVAQFVEAKSYLGDSPRMLHRFAADALNESQPETALKFVDRALSLLSTQIVADLNLYQALIELRVQILLILNRSDEALTSLEEAREHLPNNPSIARWLERVKRN
jgi:Arc/MetJ-type ribon-helix-helix transcriptional regulator